LLDTIFVRLVCYNSATQATPALGALALKQVPLSGSGTQYFAAAGDFESFGNGLPGFDTLRATHNLQFPFKKSAQYRNRVRGVQVVFWACSSVQGANPAMLPGAAALTASSGETER
jgi:hypothetical protein